MEEIPQPTDKFVEVDGLRLHYLDWGNPGPHPMVLLHGLQDCARSWDFFAQGMRNDYHVMALDSRGHGDSQWANVDGYQFQDYITDIEALFDSLELKNVILIGHSAGARYAFTYTARHPEKVEALGIIDIDPDAVNPDSQGMFDRYKSESDEYESLEAVIERLRSRQPNSTDEMLTHQAKHMTKSTSDGKLVWKRDRRVVTEYERPDLWDVWSQIKCPTLIQRGRQSRLLTHEVAVKMREAIPRVRLAELDGGGHWYYQESPEAFEITVRWFLENPP